MKILAFIICYLIYPFSFLVPRSKNKIAFGSFRGAFSDNSKYLFIYAHEHLQGKAICWLSSNKQTVDFVRSIGLPAQWILSPRGVWFALRAKTWYINAYTSDIMFCLSGGASVVNLWHGVGLKRCEFNIQTGALAKRYVDKQTSEVFMHPEVFRRPDWLVSPTLFQSTMFASAFRIPIDRCLSVGYPRNQILTWPENDIKLFLQRYEPRQTLDLVKAMQTYSRVLIYMPTWRDSQLDVFTQQFDFNALEAVLKEQNALMLLKPHPNTHVKNLAETDHIKLVPNSMDVYGLLPFTDVLITDYSSILYDYLLMPEKQVILYLYDMQEYVKDRDFYYPFEENVCGKRAYDWASLLDCIQRNDYPLEEKQRTEILHKFWGNTLNTDASDELLKRL